MADEYKRPGWYPAPDGEAGERWWNGSGWSDSRRVGAVPQVAVPPVYSASNPPPPRPNPYAPPALSAASPVAFAVSAPQNRLALAALVTGVIGLFGFTVLGPVAIVLGLVSLAKVRQLRAQGSPTGSALALSAIGIVTGVIATVILITVIISFIAAFSIDYTP